MKSNCLKCYKVVFALFVVGVIALIGLPESTFATTTTSSAGTVMRVVSETSSYSLGQEFTVTVDVENPLDFYAGDIVFDYDKTMFNLKQVTIADDQKQRIYAQGSTTTSAGTRVIVASNGPQYGMSNSQSVLKLTFEAVGLGQDGYININSTVMANGYGHEYSLACFGTRIDVGGEVRADTNNDGRISIGDLAVASRFMGTSYWETYRPDVDSNGFVDVGDLDKIVNEILKS